MFIGRERELKEIKESLGRHDYQGILIYGRRRIGKTELIKEGLVNCRYRVLSFEFRRATLKANLDLFAPCVKDFFHDPYAEFKTFDSLFDYLLNKSASEEYVLSLDEFSFLLTEDFSIESSLAAAIDKYKTKSKIHLFVSGSYVGLMEKMIGQSSHSYGRFSHVILVKPFNYFESAKFYPGYSSEDKIMLYGVFGGVPYFNSLIDDGKTALENLFDLMIKDDSICEHEISQTIMGETAKVPLLNELLLIILRGKTKYMDIAKEFSSGGLGRPDYFIDKLIDMGIIEKVSPINDERNKKKANYAIKDNLIDFYYRYLFVAKTKDLRTDPKFFYDNFIKDDFLTKYLPRKFETISKEFLIRMNLMGKVEPPFFKIGTYVYNDPKLKVNRQFDVVTQDKKGYISYECKYTDSPINHGVVAEETFQTANSKDIVFYRLGFISKNGFAADVDANKYVLFSLADFYI